MNHSAKRYRQISLMESFAFNKRPKNINMNISSSSPDLSMTVMSENNRKLSSACPVDLQELDNDVCQAANDSVKFKVGNCSTAAEISASKSVINQMWNTDSMKVKNENCEIAMKTVTNQLWDTAVNENSEATVATPAVKSVIDELWETGDDSYENSPDLFPDEPSFEDNSVPTSSSYHSQELFIDSQKELSESQPSYEEILSESDEPEDIPDLNRSPDCDTPLPKLEPSANHSIIFSIYIRSGDAPHPYPSSYRDKWDSDHVRMPCSPLNRYPINNPMGETIIGSRWDLICQSLRSNIGSSRELERAIMKYNAQYIGKWSFSGLHTLINKHWKEEEQEHFFDIILPSMVEMALNLPNICTQPVPLLKQNKDHYVTMSQKQIGCLLLNAFFCTFPRRNPRNRYNKQRFEYASYPDINFNRLFAGAENNKSSRHIEKLKCLFNYFRRIIMEEPTGTVTFHRQVISNHALPNWYSSTRGIRNAVIKSHGLIEIDGHGMLQVDFANKFVGGGVLGQGCVQEEIRFVICPELIVSRLFVECLENNEALIIIGAEQYSKYSGYCDTFKWEGDFKDSTPRDSWGRRCIKIVAIDATNYRKTADQFKFQSMKRELNKAYCGFYEKNSPIHLSAIATGNWGCGAFKGTANLKFLLQLMAASECGRSLLYLTFENKKLKRELQNMYEFLNDKNLTVGDLWRLVTDYINNVTALKAESYTDLYHFIYSQFVIKKNFKQQNNRNSNEITDSCKKAAETLFERLTDSSQDTEDDT